MVAHPARRTPMILLRVVAGTGDSRRGIRPGRVASGGETGPSLAREFGHPGTIDNVAFFAGAARNPRARASAEYPQTTPAASAESRSAWSRLGFRRGTTHPDGAWKILPGGRCRQHHQAQARGHPADLGHVRGSGGRGGGGAASSTSVGTGVVAGAALRHSDVDMVLFTGSTRGTHCPSRRNDHQTRSPNSAAVVPFVVPRRRRSRRAAIHGAGGRLASSTVVRLHGCDPGHPTGPSTTASSTASPISSRRADRPHFDPRPTSPLISQAHRERVAGIVERHGYARVVTGGRCLTVSEFVPTTSPPPPASQLRDSVHRTRSSDRS